MESDKLPTVGALLAGPEESEFHNNGNEEMATQGPPGRRMCPSLHVFGKSNIAGAAPRLTATWPRKSSGRVLPASVGKG